MFGGWERDRVVNTREGGGRNREDVEVLAKNELQNLDTVAKIPSHYQVDMRVLACEPAIAMIAEWNGIPTSNRRDC